MDPSVKALEFQLEQATVQLAADPSNVSLLALSRKLKSLIALHKEEDETPVPVPVIKEKPSDKPRTEPTKTEERPQTNSSAHVPHPPPPPKTEAGKTTGPVRRKHTKAEHAQKKEAEHAAKQQSWQSFKQKLGGKPTAGSSSGMPPKYTGALPRP